MGNRFGHYVCGSATNRRCTNRATVSTAHIAQLGPLLFVMYAHYELEPLRQLTGVDAVHGIGMGEKLADSDDDELSFCILDEEMDKEYGNGCDDMLHGVSIVGKSGNEERYFDAAVTRMRKLYFWSARRPPVYNEIDFALRFAVLRFVFNRVYSKLVNCVNFTGKVDASGRCRVHPLQRIIGALGILRYGFAYDAVEELVGVSESTMQKTVIDFCTAVLEVFGAEYLREPTDEDLKRILAVNESRGFPVHLGRIDCQQRPWKNCPVAWAG